MDRRHVLLDVAQMYAADAAATAAGIPGTRLMEAAGRAVAEAVAARWRPCPVAVLCGPGNNGGDGFVAARRLAEAGWPVRVGLLGDRASLAGDAAWAASGWPGPVEPAAPSLLEGAGLAVDALFGAGLARPLAGAAAELVEALRASGLPVVAVDVPSGVHGDSGEVMGMAAPAVLTVTFFRRKPGHLLLPGRLPCGEIVVADIGIPDGVLDAIAPVLAGNHPDLWLDAFPVPRADQHKYDRGHAVVWSGARMTGAARLAARAARRVGAGLLTVVCPPEAAAIHAAGDPGLIVEAAGTPSSFARALADPRRNAVLIGPGAGTGPATRERALAALATGRAVVLDADALTVFAGSREDLFAALGRGCVLTPHEGEFGRLFDRSGDKVARTRRAAAEAGAVVLLKGADTVVAAPDGRAAICANAPPDLATGGSGDVLAGMVLGLLAQRMPAFEAALAAVWLHGESANAVGPGLIAEDLPDALPALLGRLREAGAKP